MRLLRLASFLLGSLLVSASVAAQQQPPPRDPQAILQLQRAITAMGGTVPTDSVATGIVVLVEGSRTETGTMRILTRRTDQTFEDLQVPSRRRAIIYSQGEAREIEGTSSRALHLERVVTSHCADFPLVLIAGALSHPETALRYIGQESLEGVQVHHLRIWNTFPSRPALQHLEEFSRKDLWMDAASGVPRKVAYTQREARGEAPRIPVALYYSDYRNVAGLLYPFLIRKSFNGTPWATITVQSVRVNTGLSDIDFPVR